MNENKLYQVFTILQMLQSAYFFSKGPVAMSGVGGIGLKNSQQDGLLSKPELQQLAAGCEQITFHSESN